MARYTQIYSSFVARLNEVSLLRQRAAALSKKRDALRHAEEISAFCRAAVVLLSSHIEAYIKEVGEHTLDSIFDGNVCRSKVSLLFFYHISKERIENIRSGSDPERIARNVRVFVDSDSRMWEQAGRFPEQISATEFNKGFSNPKFDKTKSYFSRFGYLTYRRDFLASLGNQGQVTINNLDQIIDTRNSIAHGDPNATKTPSEISDMIDIAKIFCRTTDTIFANWCRENLCNIR